MMSQRRKLTGITCGGTLASFCTGHSTFHVVAFLHYLQIARVIDSADGGGILQCRPHQRLVVVLVQDLGIGLLQRRIGAQAAVAARQVAAKSFSSVLLDFAT